MGWADLDDGPLLNAMADRFDVLVSVDKNLPKQQRIDNRPLAVIGTTSENKSLGGLTSARSQASICVGEGPAGPGLRNLRLTTASHPKFTSR